MRLERTRRWLFAVMIAGAFAPSISRASDQTVIQKVSVAAEKEFTVVRIDASALSPNGYIAFALTDPPRLVVDFQDASLSRAVTTHIGVHDHAVAQVSSSSFFDEGQKVTRVEIQ